MSRPLLIAIMGATGSGKTSFVNLASGGQMAVGDDLESCTAQVQPSPPFLVDGHQLVLIDTPGFDDTNVKDSDILNMITSYLTTTYREGTLLTGIIYMHRISDIRMGGISRRNFRVFREICGDSSMNHVTIVSNMWGAVSPEVGQARETQLATSASFFQPAIEKGAGFVRHDRTIESAHSIIRGLIANSPFVLQIQREVVDENKGVDQTAAAAIVEQELLELKRKHEEELRREKEELDRIAREKEEALRREAEAEQARIREEMRRAEEERQRVEREQQAELERQQLALRQAQEEAQRLQREFEERQRLAWEEQQRQFQEAHRQAAEARHREECRIQELQRQIRERNNRDSGGCTVQ